MLVIETSKVTIVQHLSTQNLPEPCPILDLPNFFGQVGLDRASGPSYCTRYMVRMFMPAAPFVDAISLIPYFMVCEYTSF